jgi:hypothetical protein
MIQILAGILGGIGAIVAFVGTRIILESFKYGWVFILVVTVLLIGILIGLV